MASTRAAFTMASPFISATQPAKAIIAKSSPTLRLLNRRSQTVLSQPARHHHRLSKPSFLPTVQKHHFSSSPSRLHESQPASPPQTQGQTDQTRPSDRPSYELRFTCKPCNHRSSHIISKQGYHHGSVLISCPNCRNRHIISDHLKIFGDKAVTIEDILREKGQLIKKGTLGEDEDVEFWEDGTVTERRADLCDREKERLDKYARDKAAGLTGDLEGKAPGSTFKSVRPGEKKDGDGQGEA
ncbi:DNL zinc finger domain containing protein [Naviculisporaceae sp. PSN 640]